MGPPWVGKPSPRRREKEGINSAVFKVQTRKLTFKTKWFIGHQWLTPIILATWDTEIERIIV
jgi:hypothetical protein